MGVLNDILTHKSLFSTTLLEDFLGGGVTLVRKNRFSNFFFNAIKTEQLTSTTFAHLVSEQDPRVYK